MLEAILYVLFFLSAVLLVLIILVQEGKGGGLTDAFGGAGVEAFGVRPGGINKFTFGLFAAFVLCAMGIHWLNRNPESGSVMEDQQPWSQENTVTPDQAPPLSPPQPDTGGTPQNPAPDTGGAPQNPN